MSGATADKKANMQKIMPDMSIERRRPYRSATAPPASEPTSMPAKMTLPIIAKKYLSMPNSRITGARNIVKTVISCRATRISTISKRTGGACCNHAG